MPQKIKFGGLHIEVPDDSPLLAQVPKSAAKPLVAEKAEEPAPLQESTYVFRPNDPFQASLDNVQALGNVQRTEKPWVRRTFFFFFVVFPLVIGNLVAWAIARGDAPTPGWKVFVVVNAFLGVVVLPYLAIWRRGRGTQTKKPPER